MRSRRGQERACRLDFSFQESLLFLLFCRLSLKKKKVLFSRAKEWSLFVKAKQPSRWHVTDMEEQLDHLGATKQPLKRTEKKKCNLSISDSKKGSLTIVQWDLLQPDILYICVNIICSFASINRAFHKVFDLLLYFFFNLNVNICQSRKRKYYSVPVLCLVKVLLQGLEQIFR